VPLGVKPAVWFTLAGTYPQTARKRIRREDGSPSHLLTVEEMAAEVGLARIGVAASRVPLTWADYRRMSGDNPKMLKSLERTANAVREDPALWRVSFFQVYEAEWSSVELWDASAWVPAW
jgi:hypothetical protein